MRTAAILPPIVAAILVAAAPAAENIALGKAYVLDPPPDYPHCTDPGDAVQLTDGKRVEGYFWTQPGTVGWSGRPQVSITIDLGKAEPIGGVSYGTAAGVGAYTPLFLDRRTVTAGKHMEAVREGVEDFEVLRMLRDRIGDAEGAGAKPEALAAARALLAGAADRVTAPLTAAKVGLWKEPKDRGLADRVRGEVLDALEKLGR